MTGAKATEHRPSLHSVRKWFLVGVSVAGVFVLQPASAVRNLVVWLPALSLLFTIGVWFVAFSWRDRRPATIIVAGLLALLVVLKSDPAALELSRVVRAINGQDVTLAAVSDLSWIGFSYIVFRLIHVLRDVGSPRMPVLTLPEFITYVLFTPTLIAGPIDRGERFIKDLRADWRPSWPDIGAGMQRLVVGAFKKFVLADALALVALNGQNAFEVRGSGWMWLLVLAFAARIYFDFSGYTDMALGLARWFGIYPPENFAAPYLKPNITQFWNSWHMSLSAWFRTYWFNPVLRALRARKLPMWSIVGICHLSTMVLIGLWHGVTANFVIWGAWHAVGLFAHNRWTEFVRSHPSTPSGWLWTALSTAVTCLYVSLGWVWFVVPDTVTSVHVFRVLFMLN